MAIVRYNLFTILCIHKQISCVTPRISLAVSPAYCACLFCGCVLFSGPSDRVTPVPQGPFDTYGWWPSGVHHHGMAIAHGELLLSQKDSTMTKTRFSTVVGMGLLASSLFLLPMATSTFAQTTTPTADAGGRNTHRARPDRLMGLARIGGPPGADRAEAAH